VSLLVGAQLLGILGVLLAIPSAAAIQIILRDWWTARGLKAPEAQSAENSGASATSATNANPPCDS
jgi:predicted PurR-regulated permease PerM